MDLVGVFEIRTNMARFQVAVTVSLNTEMQ